MAAVALVGGDDSARWFACEKARGGEELGERLRGPGGAWRLQGDVGEAAASRRWPGATSALATELLRALARGRRQACPWWAGPATVLGQGKWPGTISLSLSFISVFFYFLLLFVI